MVVLLLSRVLVKIRDNDRKERRECWAKVLPREEIQSKRIDVYKF